MKQKKKYILILLLVVVLALIYVGISRIYYNRMTDQSLATLSIQDYYLIKNKGCKDSLIVVPGNDSTIFVTVPTDTIFLQSITQKVQGVWVNKFWFYSCHGCLAVNEKININHIPEKPVNKRLSPDSLKNFIKEEKKDIDRKLGVYTHQQKEINYYFESHQLIDEGFDIVLRRKDVVDRALDSLRNIQKVINRIDSIGNLEIITEHRYWTCGHMCIKRKSYCNGYQMYQSTTHHTPSNARPVYIGALSNIKYAEKKAYIPTIPTDTIYIGKRDSIGRYSGLGILATRDGYYYEGNFSEGEHDGFGVAFDNHVRAGKWVSGLYKGEQPVYSANHVYGMDISRYQHENSPGTKHWAVDWSKMRITSLGTKSEKKVNGEINFPISFVFIKATESTNVKNKYYSSDYKNARANGLRVGSYHFFSTKATAENQAKYFLSHSHYNKGDMPPVLDVEPTPAQISHLGGSNVLLWSVRVWMETVEKKLGVKPILYVDHIFFNKYLSDENNRLTKKYDVWISRYGRFRPVGHLRFWQLCPDGHVAGIHPEVDINIFNGNMEAFKKYNR